MEQLNETMVNILCCREKKELLIVFNNYSPQAQQTLVNIHQETVEVNIHH